MSPTIDAAVRTCRRHAPRITAWLTLLVFVLQSGCAALGVKVPETGFQDSLGRVAILGAEHEAEISFEGFVHGKGEGAAQGAGSTLFNCLGGLGRGGCAGEFCGAAVILMLGICGVAGIVGGIAGATTAPGAGKVQQSAQVLSEAMNHATIQDSLSRQVSALALARGENLATPAANRIELARQQHDYSVLADQGVDTVLEVALTKAGTRGAGINAPVQLYMEAHVRLIRTVDNSELFSADYEYQGSQRKLAAWSANQGKPLLRGLEDGYLALGNHIHDSVFMLWPFPDRGAHSAGTLVAAFGLAPVEPAVRGQLTGDVLFGGQFEWITVNSLHPTLRWQAFPRASDLERSPGLAARISAVRYDVVIARESNLAPAEIVYHGEGLGEPRVTLQTALLPGSRYFWTVRARFVLDARERVTEWATTNYRVLDRLTSPNAFSYRFRTR